MPISSLKSGLIAAAALVLAWTSPSAAVTVDQDLARHNSPGHYDQYFGRFQNVGAYVTISTLDDWLSAVVELKVRSDYAGPHVVDVVLGDFRDRSLCGGAINAYCYAVSDQASRSVYNGQRLSVPLSLGADEGLWGLLSTQGFSVAQLFFGNELGNFSRVVLDDRSTTSYSVMLGEAAAVPLPASGVILLSGLASLAAVAARRRTTKS